MQLLAQIKGKFIKLPLVLSIAAIVGILPILAPFNALAATSNPAPSAKISFTFDEGYQSTFTQAAPTLAKYGLSGTTYVTTGCVGMVDVPNTCHANTDARYITWDQIAQLKNTYNWEIGSHTVSHPYLATSDADDDQPDELTNSEVVQELTQSKAELAARGYNATAFATPYGDYDNTTLAEIAKVYESHRGFADQNDNGWPYNELLLNNMPVQEGVTVSQVKAKIDAAIANNYWLVLSLHDIKTNPSTDPDDYEYSTSKLDQIAAYVKAKQDASQLRSVNVSQGLVKSDVNLLPNSSFNNGISSGWTTDSPTTITKDSGNRGSYPDATNSAKLVSTSRETHLFSPRVAVDPNMPYMLKSFLNVQSRTSGEVGFYIDEYNASGNWISGQYKKAEASVFVEQMNIPYAPSSSAVAQASLQIIVSANSGITAFVDNAQWFPLTNDPVVIPPAPVNVMPNSTFDSGLSEGWTADSTTITADANNMGSPANKKNSIRLIASTTKNIHLFSPQIGVDPAKTYSLNSYLNLRQRRSGSVGFYIDEYDSNGNWISGQYKLGVTARGVTSTSFQYQPSSTNVKKARLQVIVVRNSGIQAYFDDAQWFAN